MNHLTWDSFTKKIHIKAPIEKLYWCWATEEGITSWFLRNSEYLRDGKKINSYEYIQQDDTYTWMWYNWDGQETGKLIEANGRDCIGFSFGKTCEVIITLEQREEAVLLSLTQSKIPEDEKSKLQIFYGCSNGWTFWLTNLKAYLEHNILLNETEIDLRGFELSGYEFVNM